ncbi:MAG TPA: efflux transporter outer membrane subunit [Cytophagaceae bacterium]
MKSIIYHYILFTGIAFITLSCNTSNLAIKSTNTLPASYPEQQDSLNIALINYKEYFQDSLLTSLIDTALHNNYDVLMALQRIQAAQANYHVAKGSLLPYVSAFGSIAQRKFGLYTMDGAGNISTEMRPGEIVPIHLRNYTVGLQTAWEADLWGRLNNRKKAAYARYLARQEGRHLITTSLVAEIAITYYDLVALDQELEIVRETIQLQENALSIVKAQKEAASANELAVKQFSAQLLNSKAMEKIIAQQIVEAENKINFLLGRLPQPVARMKMNSTAPATTLIQSGVPSDLLQNRPDIREAEYELIASNADVKSAKAAFYPSFTITGAYGFEAYKTAFLFYTPESIAYSLIGSLAAPLINRSAIKAEFNATKASQLEALYNYQKSILNGYIEVYNELSEIKNLAEEATLRVNEAQELTEAVNVSNQLFLTGRANYVEVLLVQKTSLDAKLQLIDTRRRQHFATVNLYKALGGGWR